MSAIIRTIGLEPTLFSSETLISSSSSEPTSAETTNPASYHLDIDELLRVYHHLIDDGAVSASTTLESASALLELHGQPQPRLESLSPTSSSDDSLILLLPEFALPMFEIRSPRTQSPASVGLMDLPVPVLIDQPIPVDSDEIIIVDDVPEHAIALRNDHSALQGIDPEQLMAAELLLNIKNPRIGNKIFSGGARIASYDHSTGVVVKNTGSHVAASAEDFQGQSDEESSDDEDEHQRYNEHETECTTEDSKTVDVVSSSSDEAVDSDASGGTTDSENDVLERSFIENAQRPRSARSWNPYEHKREHPIQPRGSYKRRRSSGDESDSSEDEVILPPGWTDLGDYLASKEFHHSREPLVVNLKRKSHRSRKPTDKAKEEQERKRQKCNPKAPSPRARAPARKPTTRSSTKASTPKKAAPAGPSTRPSKAATSPQSPQTPAITPNKRKRAAPTSTEESPPPAAGPSSPAAGSGTPRPTKRARTKRAPMPSTPPTAPAAPATPPRSGGRGRGAAAGGASRTASDDPRVCHYCGADSTPMWRHGPASHKDLCNKCGVKYLRKAILQDTQAEE